MKIVFSKEKDVALNVDNIIEIFVPTDSPNVLATAVFNNSKFKLGTYTTKAEATFALQILFNQLALNDVGYLPSDKEVKAYLISHTAKETNLHHATGKKVKRKGGS